MPRIGSGPVGGAPKPRGTVTREQLPFPEQIDFFRKKLNVPTERWDDIMTSAHDRAFVSAGAAKAELLTDLRGAVDAAIAQGKTLEQFRKEFGAIVDKHGWAHTGSRDWRSRIIYETNLATSYAAARYQQLTDPDLLKAKPYWQYKHNESVAHPRPLHQSWDGVTLPAQHAWFDKRFPPNGWGCRCRIVALSAKEAKGKILKDGPDDGTWTKDRDGKPHVLPNGVEYGWDYTPGRTYQPDLDKYDPALAKQIVAEQMKDGVFSRWHDGIIKKVEVERAKPEHAGKTAAELTAEMRKMAKGEAYPVAVISPGLKELLGVKTNTVKLSDYDLLKQAISRTGQDFGADRYARAQDALESAELIVRENDQMTIFVKEGDTYYASVLQQTQSGKGLFLKSFRKSNPKDMEKQKKKGTILRG